ncbi:uncharacterized protein [Euwallacea fornicatus]|uniref:uncharacterized protein n=1 Tax=Euwallacea fornicatus TaxID=995702 RepID=UPI00338F08B8
MENLEEKKWRAAFVRKVFAVSGAVQAFSWIILATICLVLYYVKPRSIEDLEKRPMTSDTSFRDLISFYLYSSVLDKNGSTEGRVILPLSFHIICWIYLVLSGLWAALSVTECLSLFNRKSRKFSRHIQTALGVVTLLVCTLDAVVFALAFYDYYNIDFVDLSHLESDKNGDCDYQMNMDFQLRTIVGMKISYGILSTLAARGYTLWLINVAAGFYSIVSPIMLFQMPPLLQYEESSIPRPKFQTKKRTQKSATRSDDGRSSAADDEEFRSFPEEKRDWYYQRAPLPLTYNERDNEAPKFVSSRSRTSSGGGYHQF